MGMFFWLIVLFAIAWGLLDWELGMLREQQALEQRSKPVAPRPSPPAPPPAAALPATTEGEDKPSEAPFGASPAAGVADPDASAPAKE